MSTLNAQEQQVVESFRQLKPGRRWHVLLELARANPDAWKQFQSEGESRLRDAARQNGLDWELMDDRQRQDFIEEYLDGNAS